MRIVELGYEANSAGISNNESYCMGVKRECDRIYRALATRKEDEVPEAERWGRKMCSSTGGGGQELKTCETHLPCKDILPLPWFLFIVVPHDSRIIFCLSLRVFSSYNMLNLKHLENQQRQKYHHCHGLN